LAVVVSYGHGKVAELLLKSNAEIELKERIRLFTFALRREYAQH
jgi:hypothetical protein